MLDLTLNQERVEFQKYFGLKISEVENIFPNDLNHLTKLFQRSIPSSQNYISRLETELNLIQANDFIPIFLQADFILRKCTPAGVQWIVRGSAASSLVAYLLGITDIDPVATGMALARFLNPKRLNKPDIDIDFPHNIRNQIMTIVAKKLQNRVAKISNIVHYRIKSAWREAQRHHKINYHQKLSPREFNLVSKTAQSLVGNIHHYSQHCGGVVIFNDDIDKNLVLGSKPDQIKYDKRQVESAGLIKLDLLSNRALSILRALDPVRKIIDYPAQDEAIAEMFRTADTIGINYCETPAMLKIFRMVRPQSPIELSLCIALVRPAPNKKIVKEWFSGNQKGTDHPREVLDFRRMFIYDEDIIEYLADLLDTDWNEGESFRKGLAKHDERVISELTARLKKRYDLYTVNKIMDQLKDVDKQGFCKSHAYNYGYLAWALAWHKVHNRAEFWRAVLNEEQAESSMYRRWVYFRQIIGDGYEVDLEPKRAKGAWKLTTNRRSKRLCKSQQRQTTLTNWFQGGTIASQQYKTLREYGYWTTPGFLDCYIKKSEWSPEVEFKGLVASIKQYKLKGELMFYITLGVMDKEWVNLVWKTKEINPTIEKLYEKVVVIEGKGLWQHDGWTWMVFCEEMEIQV